MVDETHNSRRHQKRVVAEGLRQLKAKPGWDPSARPRSTPQDALRELGQADRTEGAYGAAEGCEACRTLRNEEGDEGALCAEHLAEAMGFQAPRPSTSPQSGPRAPGLRTPRS